MAVDSPWSVHSEHKRSVCNPNTAIMKSTIFAFTTCAASNKSTVYCLRPISGHLDMGMDARTRVPGRPQESEVDFGEVHSKSTSLRPHATVHLLEQLILALPKTTSGYGPLCTFKFRCPPSPSSIAKFDVHLQHRASSCPQHCCEFSTLRLSNHLTVWSL
jgi:hypothetical protein